MESLSDPSSSVHVLVAMVLPQKCLDLLEAVKAHPESPSRSVVALPTKSRAVPLQPPAQSGKQRAKARQGLGPVRKSLRKRQSVQPQRRDREDPPQVS